MISSVSTHSANAYLYNNLGYDPIADFTPIALIARAPSAMVVRAETPFRTLQDFVAFAKANPDKLNFAYGTWAASRACDAQCVCGNQDNRCLLSRDAAGDDRSARRTDRFRRDGCFADPGARQGRQTAHFATTGTTRVEAFPDAPTMVEAGYPDYVLFSCRAFTGPPGCRPRLSPPSTRRSAKRSTRRRANVFFAVYGSETGSMTAADFADFVKQELKRWEGIVAMTGLPKQ